MPQGMGEGGRVTAFIIFALQTLNFNFVIGIPSAPRGGAEQKFGTRHLVLAKFMPEQC